MTLEIPYKKHTNHWIYPISETVYFKRTHGHRDYTEYELECGDLSFYTTNDQLSPLHIYTNRMEEQYIVSVQLGTGLNRNKSVYHRETGERFDLHFSEHRDFFTNEVSCKRHGMKLFDLYENTFTFSQPRLNLKGTMEGNELELFISLLCFFIP